MFLYIVKKFTNVFNKRKILLFQEKKKLVNHPPTVSTVVRKKRELRETKSEDKEE